MGEKNEEDNDNEEKELLISPSASRKARLITNNSNGCDAGSSICVDAGNDK
jgi:hypothetical protein